MGITTAEARALWRGQNKWANELRKDHYKHGRVLDSVVSAAYRWRVWQMTKEEFDKALKSLGLNISYQTYYRYAKDGLITPPVTTSRGKIEGKVSEYKTQALFETFAAWSLQNGAVKIAKAKIKQTRLRANEYLKMFQYNNSELELWVRNAVMAFLAWKFDKLAIKHEGIATMKEHTVWFLADENSHFNDDEECRYLIEDLTDKGETVLYAIKMTPRDIFVYQAKENKLEILFQADVREVFNL